MLELNPYLVLEDSGESEKTVFTFEQHQYFIERLGVTAQLGTRLYTHYAKLYKEHQGRYHWERVNPNRWKAEVRTVLCARSPALLWFVN